MRTLSILAFGVAFLALTSCGGTKTAETTADTTKVEATTTTPETTTPQDTTNAGGAATDTTAKQ